MFYINSNAERNFLFFLIFKLKKSGYKPYMPKMAMKSGTRKNQVLKRHVDLTGSNKVPTLDKSPLDISPPTLCYSPRMRVSDVLPFDGQYPTILRYRSRGCELGNTIYPKNFRDSSLKNLKLICLIWDFFSQN